MVSVEKPENAGETLTMLGLSDGTGELVNAGMTAGVRLTVPVKLFRLEMMIVAAEIFPAVTVMKLGPLIL